MSLTVSSPVFEWEKRRTGTLCLPERSVCERRKREARRRRRRGSSAEDGKSFNAAGGVGERCKLPQRLRAEPGRQTTFGAFLVWKCFIWQGPR